MGNPKGEILNDVQLETTRLFSRYDSLYSEKNYGELNEEEKKSFELYKEIQGRVKKARKDCLENIASFEDEMDEYKEACKVLDTKCGGECNFKQLKTYVRDSQYKDHTYKLMERMAYGFTYSSYLKAYNYWVNELPFNYNGDIYPRSLLEDDPSNFSQTVYGNNNVRGKVRDHGTQVSGIITGIRENDLGGDGIANNALIMAIRAVPDGDERDKDVTPAICYAVDNGAMIINMSLGELYSPHHDEVIEAFRYAEEKLVKM